MIGVLKERGHDWSQMFSVFTNNVRREVQNENMILAFVLNYSR